MMPTAKRSWRHGILVRVAGVVVVSAVLVSFLLILVTIDNTEKHEHRAAVTRLNQLLDAVEGSVNAACFVGDNKLADDIALGLLKNNEVLAVRIRGDGVELARRGPPKVSFDPNLTISRQIVSPFDTGQVIGRVELLPNQALVEQEVQEEVRFVAGQLGLMLALTALAIMLVMLFAVIRPIKAMSDRLHRMNAKTGDRLQVKKWLKNTEIGRLANDVNQLAAQLVDSIEEERSLRLKHEIEEKKYHSLFAHAESGIFIIDQNGQISSWNPAFNRILGLPDDLAETSLTMADLAWEDPALLMTLLHKCLQRHARCTQEVTLRKTKSTRRWLNIVLTPIDQDTMQGVVHDITELKEAEAMAKQEAATDALTGLANRHSLEQQMYTLIKSHQTSGKGGFTLILVYLDNFKKINNGHGLPIGDAILRNATARLNSCVKNTDIVARLSGDLFGVILPGVTLGEDADKISERILQDMRQTYLIEGSPIRLSARIGITLFPMDAEDPPSLLRNAELALERAKMQGGNIDVFYDSTLAEAAERRRHLENDLRLAIRNSQFTLYYQPIIDLGSNQLAGAEALIRWNHPERGLVPPDQFIPIAEETGLIDDIGTWVLDTVCAQLAEWQGRGLGRHLSMNVSARQIPEGLPPMKLLEALRRHGVDPTLLAIEITEGVLMNDVEKAQHWLHSIREIGCRIYLDDFGTGYSSLSYLKRFPVDTLKVDKSFVQDMGSDRSDHTLVATVVAMARSLAMDAVAEGVETVPQLNLLREMGCHYAQGYFFSRPLPIEEFDSLAERLHLRLTDNHPVTA